MFCKKQINSINNLNNRKGEKIMNENMTFEEKVDYIKADFKRQVIIPTGTLPDTRESADLWFRGNIAGCWSNWILRYKDNTLSKIAEALIFSFTDEIENLYKKRFLQ